MKNILLNWALDNSMGWGIVGMNLLFQWARDKDLRPLMGQEITDRNIRMTDPLKLRQVVSALRASNEHLHQMAMQGTSNNREGVVIDALGNDFGGLSSLRGEVTIGRCIFAETNLKSLAVKLSKYDELLTASTWNAELILQRAGRKPKVIFEGVDDALFCPGPKSGVLDPDRFYIFSGGKVEYRKAQDIVLLAFKIFSARHPDAILVTAWHSPWPALSHGYRGRSSEALEIGGDGKLDVTGWATRNGIPAERFIDLGPMPNTVLPTVLREMDVCLQPSRGEPCTNLPIHEAMATGIPVIASYNTGMKDILGDGHAYPLRRQSLVVDTTLGTDGWGESDLEEIVETLERVYQNRSTARNVGLAGRTWMIENGRTWRDHARELKTWLLSLN